MSIPEYMFLDLDNLDVEQFHALIEYAQKRIQVLTPTPETDLFAKACKCDVCICIICRDCTDLDQITTYSIAQMFGICCDCNFKKTGIRKYIIDEDW
jgi:hypothetical protein